MNQAKTENIFFEKRSKFHLGRKNKNYKYVKYCNKNESNVTVFSMSGRCLYLDMVPFSSLLIPLPPMQSVKCLLYKKLQFQDNMFDEIVA